MCTLKCTIEFENAKEFYRPGEAIKGQVVLEIPGTSTVLLKALSLEFSGFAHTKWEMLENVKKVGKTRNKMFAEFREDYLAATNYLIGSEMASPKCFDPGEYRYSFLINLPQNIPSSFDSPLGFIRYSLTVNADYGDHSTILYNSPIPIEQLKDLRLIDSAAQLPAEAEQLERKTCIKFWQQPLQLNVSVPQKAFVAGECIPIHIKLANPSKLKIDSITCNLNCIVTYKGFLDDKICHKTSDKTTIVSKINNMNGQNFNLMQVLQEISIPKTPPTMTFDECKCIDLSYELEVLAISQYRKRWVRAVIPLLIGSISLRSDVKVIPLHGNSNNVASIAVARSMEELTLPSAMDLQDNFLSRSMRSLESSFQEANFMTTVHLNKKSRRGIVGDLNDFKPKYLYYDLPEEGPHDIQNYIVITKENIENI